MNPLPIERTDSPQPPGQMNREIEITMPRTAMSRRRPTNSTHEQGMTATIRVAAMTAETNRIKVEPVGSVRQWGHREPHARLKAAMEIHKAQRSAASS
jgi:hypothetical protein